MVVGYGTHGLGDFTSLPVAKKRTGHLGVLIHLPRYGADKEEGGVRLKICQQSSKTGVELLLFTPGI